MKKISSFLYNILTENPVLLHASVIAPIVFAGTSVENALLLSMLIVIITLPTVLISAYLLGNIPEKIKIACIVTVSAFMCLCGSLLAVVIDSATFETLGIYLPILSVNSIMLTESLSASKENIKETLYNTAVSLVGFIAVVILVSILRELLENNSISSNVEATGTVGMSFPFTGYFILAFVGAGVKVIIDIINKRRTK